MNESRINQHFVCILNEFWQVSPLERESWWLSVSRCERRTKRFHSVTQHHRHRRRHKIYKLLHIESHTKPHASWNWTWTASAAKAQKIKLLSKYQQRWIDRAEAIVAHAERLPRASTILRVECERIKYIYKNVSSIVVPRMITWMHCICCVHGARWLQDLRWVETQKIYSNNFVWFHFTSYRFVSGVRRSGINE